MVCMPLHRIGLPARGQQTVGAARNHVFEGAIGVLADVEGAVKRDLERTCQLDQFRGACAINDVFAGQHPSTTPSTPRALASRMSRRITSNS